MIYELEQPMNLGETMRAWPVLESETSERAGYILAANDGTEVSYEQSRGKCHTTKELEWITIAMREIQKELLAGKKP